MSTYFDGEPCKVCGRRDCIHIKNDEPILPGDIADKNCKVCNGTGQYTSSQTSLDFKPPKRNMPCICGSGKKYKNCCMGNVNQAIQQRATKTVCECARSKHIKLMKERVKLPCSICGKEGYCEHRLDLEAEDRKYDERMTLYRHTQRMAIKKAQKAIKDAKVAAARQKLKVPGEVQDANL